MNFKKLSICIILLLLAASLTAQKELALSPFSKYRYNDSLVVLPKRPLRAAVEVFGLNIGLWAFDRYALKGDYAYINFNSIKNNLKTGFVWDNDYLNTSFMGHPYNGGLYFSAARSNGMNFWQSIPFAVGGSVMWELFMENDLPATNDVIATPLAGIYFGETTFRLSDLLIDDRTRGWDRFGREFLIALVSPMRGLNRIINGDAWRKGHSQGRSVRTTSAAFNLATGYRGLAENSTFTNKVNSSMFVDLKLIYGDLFEDGFEKPYDYFSMRGNVNVISNQPIVSSFNGMGMIWGKEISLKKEHNHLAMGIFQHFNYYNFNPIYSAEKNTTFQLAEAVSFGVGAIYRADLSQKSTYFSSAFLNGIGLGAYWSDYLAVKNRSCNYGSGFSAKLNMGLVLDKKVTIMAGLENYRLFTWKGYNPNLDISKLTEDEMNHLNIMGNKGNGNITVLNFAADYLFKEHYTVSAQLSYYFRRNRYSDYPDTKFQIMENKVGVGYLF